MLIVLGGVQPCEHLHLPMFVCSAACGHLQLSMSAVCIWCSVQLPPCFHFCVWGEVQRATASMYPFCVCVCVCGKVQHAGSHSSAHGLPLSTCVSRGWGASRGCSRGRGLCTGGELGAFRWLLRGLGLLCGCRGRLLLGLLGRRGCAGGGQWAQLFLVLVFVLLLALKQGRGVGEREQRAAQPLLFLIGHRPWTLWGARGARDPAQGGLRL